MQVKRIIVLAAISYLINGCASGRNEKVEQNIQLPTKPVVSQSDQKTEETNKTNEPAIDPKTMAPIATVDKECKTMVVSTSLVENSKALANLGLELSKSHLINIVRGDSESLEIKKAFWRYSKNYVWLPIELEKKYGDYQHKSSFQQNILDESAKSKLRYEFANQLLQEILANIKEPHVYTFKIYILTESGQNAHAGAGGNIYINLDLAGGRTDNDLRKLNRAQKKKLHDDSLLKISHEVTHILQRHQTKLIQARIMDAVDLKELVTTNYASFTEPSHLSQFITPLLVGKKVFTRYHVDQELQADSCGLVLASRTVKDRRQLQTTVDDFLKLLAQMENQEKTETENKAQEKISTTKTGSNITAPELNNLKNGMQKLEDMLSSPIDAHPTTPERIGNFQAMYRILDLNTNKFCIVDKSCSKQKTPTATTKKVIEKKEK